MKRKKLIHLLVVVLLCFPAGTLQTLAVGTQEQAQKLAADTKEDLQELLKQYNALGNDELKEQVFIELYIDYVDSFDKFLQAFQANPNDPELERLNEEFIFNFAHFSNVLEAVYDRDHLSKPIELVLPLIELHNKLATVSNTTQKLMDNRDNQSYVQNVLENVNQLLPFLKQVSAELDDGGYVETINNQVNFAQNYGEIQNVENALAQETTPTEETPQPEQPAALAPSEESNAADDSATFSFEIKESEVKKFQEIVWTTKTQFEELLKSFTAVVTKAKNTKSLRNGVSDLVKHTKQIQDQQNSLNTWLQSQVDSEQIKQNYNAYLQLVNQIGLLSFQISDVAKNYAPRYQLLHDEKEEHTALLHRITTTFVQEGNDLFSTVFSLTGEEKATFPEKFKQNTAEVQTQFLSTFSPQAQKMLTDGQGISKDLGKLKAVSKEQKQLTQAIDKKRKELQKKAKQEATKKRKELAKQKLSEAKLEKIGKEYKDSIQEIQKNFQTLASTFVNERKTDEQEEFNAQFSLITVQTGLLTQKILALKEKLQGQKGNVFSTDEYDSFITWLDLLRDMTGHTRSLSTTLQKNWESVAQNFERMDQLKTLTEKMLKISQQASIPTSDLKGASFFGIGTESYQNAGIKDFFKKVGNALTTVAKIIIRPVTEVIDLFKKEEVLQAVYARNGNVTGRNWMSKVRDNAPLGQISIPGTHDTMTYLSIKPGIKVLGTALAKCQDSNLEQQLYLGVRYLDIRLNDNFGCIHGAMEYQGNFNDQVFAACKKFLDENKTETILMRLPGNNGNPNWTKNPDYQNYFWVNSSGTNIAPTLKEVRGKIVPLSGSDNFQINGVRYGIKYEDKENSVVQDDYSAPTEDKKLKEVKAQVDAAANASSNDKRLYLNYVSAAAGKESATQFWNTLSGDSHITPEGYSDTLNPKVRKYVNDEKTSLKKVGVIISDFVGTTPKKAVPEYFYSVNFR